MSQFFISRCVIATGLALTLFGCGVDEEGNAIAPPPTEVFPIVAMDGFSVAAPNKATYIDLTPYVRGGQATLTSVRYDGSNEECQALTKNGLGFDVKTQSGALCDYQFTVSNAQTSDSASMKVFSTQAVNAILPPLSHAMVLNGANEPLNLPTLLGTDWPAGYSLDASSVTVQGSEDNLGVASSSGNIITYMGPDFSGWNRIIYTLTNETKPNENVFGSIYITVSESVNQPPRISKPKYNYNVENGNAVVLTGDNIDINLASFITEPDGQQWQLIVAQSYTATVTPKNASSITNKNILFSSGTVGEHIISYVVADHFGGYSAGLIQVTVSVKEHEVTWNALDVGSTTYIAPLRYSDGVDTGFNVTPLWDSSINNTIAGYNENSAEAYCNTVGTIPSVSEMARLRTAHYTELVTTGELNKWPTMKPYLVRNDVNTAYLGYDITTGEVVGNRSGLYYLTCVVNPNLDMSIISRQVIANGDTVRIAMIAKAPSTNVILSQVATGLVNELSDNDVNRRESGSSRELMVTVQSVKAGVYRFKVVNSIDPADSVSSPIIHFHADVTTARLMGLTVNINDAQANNADVNKITATILDANGNPVANQKITVDLTDVGIVANSAMLINPQNTLITDINGSVTLSITNSEPENVDVYVGYVADASSSVGNSEQNVRIVFSPKAYCHQFLGVNDLNCLPYAELNNGKIFTASPSKQWKDNNTNTNISALATSGVNNENGSSGHKGAYYTWAFNQINELCNALGSQAYLGRSNWRLPEIDELSSELHTYYANLFIFSGWPTFYQYQTRTRSRDGRNYMGILLDNTGRPDSFTPITPLYASCVSER
jgi:hypothetical protein